MGLAGEYNDLLLTEFLIETLKTGEIPTVQELSEQLDELKNEYPLIGKKPLFSVENNFVKYYENASASKHNSTYERLQKDIHLLYDVMHEIQQRITKEGARWSTFYETMRRYCDDLEDRIDALLLMDAETLGYYKYVSDDFLTVDEVDLDNTNAEVETNAGIVQISHSLIQGDGHSRLPLTDVTSSNITASSVSGPGVVSLGTSPGSSLENIVKDESSTWLGLLKTTNQNQPATISVGIKLTDTEDYVEFNKVVASLHGSTATSAFIITLWYSTNNVDWVLVPTDSYTQSTLDVAVWTFKTIKAKYIKFTMTKNAPDDIDGNGYYSWDFGFKSVKLYRDAYETRVGHTLQTTARTPDDEANAFTKAALSVCEATHDETNISYYLSVDEGASFHAVDPIERKNPTKPQVLDFSELQRYSNNGSSNVYDNNKTATELDTDNVAGESLEAGELPLNFYIGASNISGLIENGIIIWRNTGTKGGTNTVRNRARGWSYDDDTGHYNCYIYVSDPNGIMIDFGQDTAWIDGNSVTGSVVISAGSHSFETSSANWLDITPSADSLEDLLAVDSLYPYNHKLLIEGYLYGTNYTDEEVYKGVSIFAELQPQYRSRHGFKVDTDSDDLTVYTRNVDDSGNLLFVFKTDRSFSDYINEQILVTYPLTNQTFDSVILKAVLSTSDASVSPVLDSYLVKLG